MYRTLPSDSETYAHVENALREANAVASRSPVIQFHILRIDISTYASLTGSKYYYYYGEVKQVADCYHREVVSFFIDVCR